MSGHKKNQSSIVGNDYKLEALEPRLMMAADAAHTLSELHETNDNIAAEHETQSAQTHSVVDDTLDFSAYENISALANPVGLDVSIPNIEIPFLGNALQDYFSNERLTEMFENIQSVLNDSINEGAIVWENVQTYLQNLELPFDVTFTPGVTNEDGSQAFDLTLSASFSDVTADFVLFSLDNISGTVKIFTGMTVFVETEYPETEDEEPAAPIYSVSVNDIHFDGFSVEITKTDIETEIKGIGLFDAKISDGIFNFEVSGTFDDSEEFQVSMDVNLSGDVSIFYDETLIQEFTDVKFTYNSDEGHWNIPNLMNAYTSISGTTLLNQLNRTLQQIDTAIQKVVSEKLESGIGKGATTEIVRFASKIEEFLYNDTPLSLTSADENGALQPKFENFDELNELLTSIWNEKFPGIDAPEIRYDDTERKIVIDFDFSIDFLDKAFTLDLRSALNDDENDSEFSGVDSISYLKVSGNGALAFTLEINLAGAVLIKDRILDDLQKKQGIVSDTLEGGALSGDADFVLTDSLGNPLDVSLEYQDSFDDMSIIDLVSHLQNALDSAMADSSYTGISYTIQLMGNRLQILSNDEFSLAGSAIAGAYSELGFAGSTLQTVQSIAVSSLTNPAITLTLAEYQENGEIVTGTSVPITITLSGTYLTLDELIAAFNDYLTDVEKFKVLFNISGYSLSNYYGLYVSGGFEESGNYYVQFACDNTRVKDGNKTFRLNGSGVQFMRQSSELLHKGRFESELGITIVLGAAEDTIYVNATQSSSLSELVKKINDKLENNELLSGKVSAVLSGNRIVFETTESGFFSVSCKELGLSDTEESSRVDFVVNGINIVLEYNDTTTIIDLIDELNTQLLGQGIEFKIVGDHIEAVSASKFTLEASFGTSLLELLGFNRLATATLNADGKFSIAGKALFEMDLSERVSFSNLDIEVDLSLQLGGELEFSVESIDGEDSAVLAITVADDLFPSAGDYIQIEGAYFRISEVNTANKKITISTKALTPGGVNVPSLVVGSTLSGKLVSVTEANIGLVEALLLADGTLNLEGKYSQPEGGIGTWREKLEAGFTVRNDGEFNLTAFVTLAGETFEVGTGFVKYSAEYMSLLSSDGKPDISAEFDFNEGIINELKDLSVETLLGFMNNLVLRVEQLTGKMDDKIPLINKSVSDLVNLSRNLNEIVTQIRKIGVSSLQEFETLLNKYLEEAFSAVNDNENPLFRFRLESGELLLDFNFSKSFQTTEQLNFSAGNESISGNAGLQVTGSIDLSFSAAVKNEGNWDLVLRDAMKLNAGVQVIGEKLSFILGIGGLGSEYPALLSNIISVGTDGGDSFVFLKANIEAIAGANDDRLSILDISSILESVNVSMSVEMYGRLPVSVFDYYIGSIVLGSDKFIKDRENLSNINSDIKYSDIKLENYKNGDGNYRIDLINSGLDFGFVTNSDQRSELEDNVFVADLSEILEKIESLAEEGADLFEKMKLAVSGLDLLLENLDDILNSGLANLLKDLPVVGEPLSKGADFIMDIQSKVIEPLSKLVHSASGLDAKSIAGYLTEYLKDYLPNGVSIDYTSGNDFAEWYLNLGGLYSVGTGLDLDLGYPGLGLKTYGGIDLGLLWSLEFGFGISESEGFYLILDKGAELDISLLVDTNAVLRGSLAGLGLEMEISEEDTLLTGSIALDLNSDYVEAGKEHVGFGEILSLDPSFTYGAEVDIDIAMTLGIMSDVESEGAPKFPNISGNFVFNWVKEHNGGDATGNIIALGFQNLEIDMGKFISDVLGPIIGKIQSVLEPIEPLIDFLTTPFPVLDDLGLEITVLDLASAFAGDKFNPDMIYAIENLIDLSKKINAASGELSISLPDLMLIKEGEEITNDLATRFLKGESSKTQVLGLVDNGMYIEGGTAAANNIEGDAYGALSDKGIDVKNDSNWTFIWNNPTDIFKLILGQDIDLVHYDMPALSFEFDWDKFFRIWGPLGVRAGISLGVTIDFAFGYDTFGIRQWIASDYQNYGSLLNGFYVDDLKNGVDVSELRFSGGLTASAEVNVGVSAGVGGGVGVSVGINLFDPNRDGKVRLSEIAETVKYDGPFGLFDVNGKITAKLYAYVDLLFVSKKWNITSDITLFDFSFEHKRAPIMASQQGDDVIANVGNNSENRINGNLIDGDETLELVLNGKNVSWDGGRYSLTVNNDGRLLIDAGKGNDKIILTGNASFNIVIYGGDGNDQIDLSGLTINNGYFVTIYGGAGNDKIIGANGFNIIFGDNGDYRVSGSSYTAETIVDAGVAGSDTIFGGSGRDFIFGGAGSDKIAGLADEDILIGDGGRITWTGSNRTNLKVDRTSMSGDGGDDVLIGGEGADTVYGGAGNDKIDGSEGNDTLYGEKGNDRILGGAGNDMIDGGAGMDVIFGDRFTGILFAFGDVFSFNGATAFTEEFKDFYGVDLTINLGDFNFSFKNREVNYAAISESDFDFGNDTIFGGNDHDVIFGDGGSESAAGGNDKIDGGAGHDLMDGNGGGDMLDGGLGNDTVYGGLGSDAIYGGAGNDSLYGDNGVRDYEVFSGEQVSGELTYGLNLGLGSLFKNQTTEASAASGSDKIYTGSGMDFADGQGGNDSVYVEFMGDSSTSYANIADTGSSVGDSLVIEATGNNDHLLARASAAGLGFVSLLPTNAAQAGDGIQNTNIERVNFWKSIDRITLNAGNGDDVIAVDGTIADMIIDGGSGDDSFQVGQMFKSERNSSANVVADDAFATTETTEGFLSDGVSENTSLTLQGNSGDDSFNVYRNVGALNLLGEAGSDTFGINGFVDVNTDEVISNGTVSVAGGSGADTMNLRGSTSNDTFVISKKGIASNITSVAMDGVETTSLDGSAGDDMFSVTGNNADETTIINGGAGNDTVIAGGLLESVILRSADILGQACTISHTVINGENADSRYLNAGNTEATFSVVDTSASPAVILLSDNGEAGLSKLSLTEGGNGSFCVSYGGALQAGETITVTISAPSLSAAAINTGNRGIRLSTAGNGSGLQDTIEVTLSSGNLSQRIYVYALDDSLDEAFAKSMLSIKSVWVKDETSTVLTSSVSSLTVDVSDADLEKDGLIAFTDEYNLLENSFELSASDSVVMVYLSNRAALLFGSDYTITGGVLKLSAALYEQVKESGANLYVHYRTASVALSDSKINLAYDNVQLTSVILRNGAEDTEITSVRGDGEYYYTLNGTTLAFYISATGKLVTLSGNLTIAGSHPEVSPETSNNNPSSQNAVHVIVEQSEKTLVEQNSNTDLTDYSTATYKVRLSHALSGTDKVYVKVSPQDMPYGKGPAGNALYAAQLSVSAAGYEVQEDGSLILIFDASNWESGITVTVKALQDTLSEDTSIMEIAAGNDTITDIDGAVYAYGNGDSGEISFEDPMFLFYNHLVNEVPAVSETNAYSAESQLSLISASGKAVVIDSSALAAALGLDSLSADDLFHKTLKFVNSDSGAETEWFRIENAVLSGNQWTLTLNTSFEDITVSDFYAITSVNRDYLFADENANSDRLFVNNQDNNADATGSLSRFDKASGSLGDSEMPMDSDALRFTHTDIHDKGISFSEFEYSELNLGSGKDTFTVSDSMYREDGFQTFTVVNSGDGDDNVTVNSYKAETATELGSGICSLESESDDGFIYTISGFSGTEIAGLDLENLAGLYVEVTHADGTIQRRAVVSLNESSFTLSRSLLVSGAVSFRLITGLTGDGQLVINGENGNDTITATGAGITREGMIIFGGDGSDSISVDNSAYVFGDTGEVTYKDAGGTVITKLGGNAGVDDLQTDGVRREASEFVSTEDSVQKNRADRIIINGDDNIVIGGGDSDTITLNGSNNIALGDGGRILFDTNEIAGLSYGDTASGTLRTVETLNDKFGGDDEITTGNGNNILFGGAGADRLTTKAGDDIIAGDGGILSFDASGNLYSISNDGRIDGGDDIITAGIGNNTVFGGAGNDTITTGIDASRLAADIREAYSNDSDVVLGDNGTRTFGSRNEGLATEGTVSFNFQGNSSSGLASEMNAGASDYAANHWNNIFGSVSGTYGNGDSELVYLSDGSLASGINISYGGSESHRLTSTDSMIRLQGYEQQLSSSLNAGDRALMSSGLLTTAPNNERDNRLIVEADGLAQYFTGYDVIVYLDAPDQHSAASHSIRKVTLYVGDVAVDSFFVDDSAGTNFNGNYILATGKSAETATAANYVVFTGLTTDNFRIEVTDGVTGEPQNGLDLPSIAGLQIRGTLHKKDVIWTSGDSAAGDDVISTGGGEDIILGGAGNDFIASFGDVRDGNSDSDLVFGDGGMVIVGDRNGDGVQEVISAESSSVTQLGEPSYDDIIITGNGNDVVIGGAGNDRIFTNSQDEISSSILEDSGFEPGANVPQALRDLASLQDNTVDGLKVISLNFTSQNAGADTLVTGSAGAVADSNWNNIYLYNNGFHVHGNDLFELNYSNSGVQQTTDGISVTISAYNVGTPNNGNNSSITFENHDQLDGDSENSKLFNSYYGAHSDEQIELNIGGIESVMEGSPYDVYVYLDSDNSDSDTYNYIYELFSSSSDPSYAGETRYVNDWTGNNFGGEFREVTATSPGNVSEGLTPRVEMIGNYVVFRGVTGDTFNVILRNYYTGGGQWPKNLPVITGVQIVANTLNQDLALNGDYDNDVVLGDDGAVSFALDVPYAADEVLQDAVNKVISAVSDTGSTESSSANDLIVSGRGRDTIAGGNGSDAIDSGDGDDAVIGDNAKIILKNYNPVGMRVPTTEIVLDQHTIHNHLDEAYIDTSSSGAFEAKWNQGQVKGIELLNSELGGEDLIDAGRGNDFAVGGEGKDTLIANAGTSDVMIGGNGDMVIASQNYSSSDEYLNDLLQVLDLLSENDQTVLTGFAENDFNSLPSLGSVLDGLGNDDNGGNTGDGVYDISYGAQTLTLSAGESAEIVSYVWPGNPWWTPNIILTVNGDSAPELLWEWDNVTGAPSSVQTAAGHYFIVDIPDAPNEENRYVIRVVAMTAGTFTIAMGNQ